MAGVLNGYRGNNTGSFKEISNLVGPRKCPDGSNPPCNVDKGDLEVITNPTSNESKTTSLGDASKKNTVGVINMGSSKGITKTYDASQPEGSRISTSKTTPVIPSSDDEAAEMARIEAYAKKHKVKGSVYEKKPKGGFLGLGPIIPNHNTQNMKAQSQQANKTRRIGARKNRQKNRQEFFSNIGTGKNIENYKQRKKGGTTKGQKNGSGNQKGEGGCLAGQCTPG
jgi:hypothetical protein